MILFRLQPNLERTTDPNFRLSQEGGFALDVYREEQTSDRWGDLMVGIVFAQGFCHGR